MAENNRNQENMPFQPERDRQTNEQIPASSPYRSTGMEEDARQEHSLGNEGDRSGRDRQDKGTGKVSRTSSRGFASMDPDKQREIASKGGKAAHQSGHAHQWNSEQAREAGRKGGQASGNRSQR